MWKDKEVNALLRLLDDPDGDVYETVAGRIMNYGKAIIPNLEALWENTDDTAVQSRIETLIHRVQLEDLQEDFHEWAMEKNPGLLRGAMLVARFQYPQLNSAAILGQVDAMRRNIWLELNNYLTPLEQVNIFNSILYSYYHLQGHELSEREPTHFFLNQVLDSKQGNGYTIGVLYLALCELLDIPVFAVEIPRQLVFAYIDAWHPFLHPERAQSAGQITFFLDPMNGAVYTRRDVDAYLNKIGARDKAQYLAPLDNRRVIYKMLEELALCYRYRREDEKADEVQALMRVLVLNGRGAAQED
jgi:regulator of sirC expression with transglutaminase-like and TPR domain